MFTDFMGAPISTLYSLLQLEIDNLGTKKKSELKIIKKKRVLIRKSLIGKNKIIEVTFKNGKTAKYDQDQTLECMKEKLEKMNCWEKYKSYTSSTSIPVIVRSLLITD